LRWERSSVVFLNVSNVLDAFYLRYGSPVVDDRLIKSNVAYLNQTTINSGSRARWEVNNVQGVTVTFVAHKLTELSTWTKLVGLDAILLLHGDVTTATVYS